MEVDSNDPFSDSNDAHERLQIYDAINEIKEHTKRDSDNSVPSPREIPDMPPLQSNEDCPSPSLYTHHSQSPPPPPSPPLGSSTPLAPALSDTETPPQFLECIPTPIFSSSLSPSQPTGLHWSPCGDQLAVSTDTRLQVYSLVQGPLGTVEFMPSAKIKHAECLYSWLWSSGSSSSTSMLVTTGRYQPVQLYTCHTSDNLLDIQLESTYKCINQLDELSHAFSVALDKANNSIYCGLKGEVRVFDVNRPGRFSSSHITKSGRGQSGIISCLAVSEVLPVYAAGCYDRTVGLYSSQGDRLCVLKGQAGGVTQVTFTKDGTKLFAGGRKDNEILCWDMRQPGTVLYTLQREVNTNQTIQFSLSPCEKYISSANTDGSIRIWDLERQADCVTGVLEPLAGWLLHSDASNGVSWHPDGKWLATCSGQRHFKIHPEMDMGEEDIKMEENSLVVWNMEPL